MTNILWIPFQIIIKKIIDFWLRISELPECPQGLFISERSGRSVILGWTRGFDGNAEVRAYRLQFRAIGDTRTRLTPDWADAPTRELTADSVDIFDRLVFAPC